MEAKSTEDEHSTLCSVSVVVGLRGLKIRTQVLNWKLFQKASFTCYSPPAEPSHRCPYRNKYYLCVSGPARSVKVTEILIMHVKY
jgi:hypothetical protein